jgi:hypothetical protein
MEKTNCECCNNILNLDENNAADPGYLGVDVDCNKNRAVLNKRRETKDQSEECPDFCKREVNTNVPKALQGKCS